MPPNGPVSPAISARIIHAALVLGVLTFWLVGWYIGQSSRCPRKRCRTAGCCTWLCPGERDAVRRRHVHGGPARAIRPGGSQDEWWRENLGKAIVVWSLVEAPSLLGLVAYTLTRDFRTLIATFIGLLFFGSYRPSRLIER